MIAASAGNAAGVSHDARLERRWRRRLGANAVLSPPRPSRSKRKPSSDDSLQSLGKNSNHGSGINSAFSAKSRNRGEHADRQEDAGSDLIDPDYKKFLENVREDGNSYVLEISAIGVVLKYEPDEDSKISNGSCEKKDRNTEVSCGEAEVEEAVPDAPSGVLVKEKVGLPCKTVEENPRHKREKEDDLVDQSYMKFLNCLMQEGSCEECASLDQRAKRDNPESSCDEGKSTQDNPVSCWILEEDEHSAPVINLEDEPCTEKISPATVKHSEFRKKLMEVLKLPYSKKEYEQLMCEAKQRKTVQRHKELRSGIKIYTEDRLGKSYVDHYTDLNTKLEEVNFDEHKVLNLLRGFFYWLQNLTQEGAFKPWLDEWCLKVVPGQGEE